MEMKDVMWMCGMFALLLAEAWTQERETNSHSTMNSNSSTPLKVDVFRHLSFNKGSQVNLTSSDLMLNKTISKTIFVIWTLRLRSKNCVISFSNDHRSADSCTDGKSLRNTSTAQSYLHIPEISEDDEGVYKCEWVYRGGAVLYEINVAVIVPPKVSAWWEHSGDKKVAVCRAEGGKPAANISWTPPVNLSSEETQSEQRDGLFTTESRLELLEGMEPQDVSCAVRHPFWRDEQTVKPIEIAEQDPWLPIVIRSILTVLFTGVVFAALRAVLRRQQESAPCPPTEDVELQPHHT